MAKRSKFTLSNYRLFTANMGQLVPFNLVEVLPNDTFQGSAEVFLRFSPMAAPVMHPVTVRVHHMFCPHRLVWPESEAGGWEQFITSGPDGDNSATIPQIVIGNVAVGSLGDYLGLPTGHAAAVSALPFRAFNLAFNQWFRDEQLVTERNLDDTTVPLVAWEKDYFTTARPTPQLGPAITVPLGDKAPVTGIGTAGTYPISNATAYETGGTGSVTYTNAAQLNATAGTNNAFIEQESGSHPNIYADLSQAVGVDVTTFRQAFALQRYAEARSRYGSRYVEYLRYLGVRGNLDARLQRVEYLAGGRARVNISEVLQTANEVTQGRYGVGDLYGHGVAAVRGNAYRRTFPEHGYMMSFLSVRPAAIYLDGTHRTWMRRTREEFWQRELQHIGQQEVWNGEVYPQAPNNHDTFGYQDRYSEYRSNPSGVSGEFRTDLDYWHLGRKFASPPVLNASFVECNPSKRIFNVQSQDTMWVATQNNLVARRPVAASGQPRIQ